MTSMTYLKNRLHILGRRVFCPYSRVEQAVPKEANVLDYGCGHGDFSFYLKKRGGKRRILGVDIDSGKIEYAVRHYEGDKLAFECITRLEDLRHAGFDCVVIMDVLYLLPREEQQRLLKTMHSLLPDGGLLIIKEVRDRPRWKNKLATMQEILAVKVLKITQGKQIHFKNSAAFRRELEQYGFSVSAFNIDRFYPASHTLFVALKQDSRDA
jgi:2-polyprenyl-3-methyl-5-hydroxy-6-metoxy-1,4-benzoquinol methylase